MISVSNDYKQYIKNNTAVSAQNKIIVDGVEYLGDVLKTYPKISHSSSKICGSFPVKTVSFEIYDLENCLDFEGKEIEVYKGLMLNGEPYYVKQGIFVPQKKDITTNISNRSIKFDKVQDKTQFLEDTYKSDLDWSNGQRHTGLEIVQEICTKKRITLKNNNFAFANYLFKQPNFPSSITYRQVLSRLAEIGGEIVIFNYEGQLEFKSQYNTEDIIGRDRFEKISEEKTITYNSVVLGKEGINDDIVYPNPYSETRVSLRIEDNPFVDLYREEMIEEVASHIIGLSYTSFEARNVMDGFIYELNDVINVIDRNNNTFRAVILDIENTSRTKSNLKLDLSLNDTTNYDLAGSNKQALDSLRLDVDHINNQIISVVSKTNEIDLKFNGGEEYQLTSDATYQENKEYYILQNSEFIIISQFSEYEGDKTGNPSELGLYEENIYTSYELTDDELFDETTIYYQLINDDYVEYIGDRTGSPKELELYERIDEIIGYKLTEDSSFLLGKNYYLKNYDIGDTIPSETIYELVTVVGIESQFEGLNSDYDELVSEVAKKADSGAITTIQSTVQELQTNTYKKWQVQEIANGNGYFSSDDEKFGIDIDYYSKNGDTYNLYTGDRNSSPKELGLYEYGVISAVISTEAKFSKDGMKYTKDNAESNSYINQYGLDVFKTEENSNNDSEEILFAGYVKDGRFNIVDNNEVIKDFEGQSMVYANNLLSKQDTVLGSHTLIRDYDDGTGWFAL